VDDTKEIAVGILQDHEVGARSISPWIPTRAEFDEPGNFRRLIARVQIKVEPTPLRRPPITRLERQIWALVSRIAKDDPTVPGGLSRHIP
jgi:hypothetical protein